MQKIAYCLLHSGDKKVEGLAMSLFNYDFPNFDNSENIYNNEKNFYKFKGEDDENNENNFDIQNKYNNELISERNSERSSIGNYFRSAASKKNSLKRNQSQIEMLRKPSIRFREDY